MSGDVVLSGMTYPDSVDLPRLRANAIEKIGSSFSIPGGMTCHEETIIHTMPIRCGD